MPELSIIVPVYNEAATLEKIMPAITAACPGAQVIYVDDGSYDASLAILQKNARATDVVLQGNHGGKGSAIRLGLTKAEGTYSVIQDADLEYVPKEIATLLGAAKANAGSAVFGSRFLKENPVIYRQNLIGNKALTAWLNLLFGSRITDSYTCYKLLPTDVFRGLHLTSNGFELEAEIAAKCLRSGTQILEVPISYHPRSIEEGKKINWRDGLRGIAMMVKVRMGKA